jgi:hypothetical protein
MRWLIGAVLALAQAAPLPPAYPRAGATRMLENARVLVWDISWLKQQYPLHRHPYDLVGVYYAPGDRTIVSVEGNRRPVSTKAWDIAFQRSGVTHIEEGASDSPLRAVFIEMKEAAPDGRVETAATPTAFPAGGGTQRLDNDRTTVWEFVEPLPAAPHRHLRDAVAVSFQGPTARATFVPQGTEHSQEAAGPADHLYVFELK